MKLSSKLILSFSFVALLLAGIGVSSQYYYQEIKNQVIEESQETILELQHSGDMGLKLYNSLLNAQYFLDKRYNKSIAIDTTDFDLSAGAAREKVRASIEEFNANLSAFRRIIRINADSEVDIQSTQVQLNKVLDQLHERFDIYHSLVEQLFRLSSTSFQDGREFLSVTVEPYFRTNLIPLIDKLRESTRANLDEKIDVLNARIEEVETILAVATFLAFVISIGLAFYLYNSIASPLHELGDTAKKIGAGNLDERIKIDSKDEIGELANEFNRMAENLSNTTFSKEYVDNIIESMADALIVTDEKSQIKRINSSAGSMLGYSETELLDKPIEIVFAGQEELDLMDTEDQFNNYETKYLTKQGEIIPVKFSRALMHNTDGSVKGVVCVASDITERKRAEHQIKKSLKEKEILLAEIHHRVKNNLAVISGLLQMQIWETENEAAETALRDSQLRVQSIALVHEKLYQSENLSFIEFDKYIRDLLQAISSTYMDGSSDISIHTDLESIGLNINQAIPCSLLINELVVNAYKHAFGEINSDDGAISLTMSQQEKKIYLRVKDNGKGFPEDFSFTSNKSLGVSIISTLVDQLGAELRTYNDDGAVFELSFEQEEVF